MDQIHPLPFKVLNRDQFIHRNALLEASAGTGKTFAIENIVVRLLIEKTLNQDPIPIEKILVVTFTRAATRDLKARIRSNIEKTINYLKDFLNNGVIATQAPDYLLALIEEGNKRVTESLRLLERALISYDRAQIFTIHGFCWRMLQDFALEGRVSIASSSQEDDPLVTTKLLQVIRDFLRTELRPELYSQEQLKILLKRTHRDIDKLEQQLLYEINRGVDIEPSPSFSELFEKFCNVMQAFKQPRTEVRATDGTKSEVHATNFTSQKIIEDFIAQAPSYNKLCNRNKEFLPDVMEKIEYFASLFELETYSEKQFDVLIRDGIYILEALDVSRLSKKGHTTSPPKLHYPQLLETLRLHLLPIISQARHSPLLFARLTRDCKKFLNRYKQEEELFSHTDLLSQMQKAIQYSSFTLRVQQSFQAVIIDEFQDTDPIQWDIFNTLFLHPNTLENWDGFLYLVGDPKQSIYAFRQADIYTYLSAAKQIGNSNISTLDANFRSHPLLIQGLNRLFSATDNLFPLPKTQQSLPFRQVQAGKQMEQLIRNETPCIMFWIAKENDEGSKPRTSTLKNYEENYFFPAIINELQQLKSDHHIQYSQSAILVADRYQAARLSTILKQHHIPVRSQKGIDLAKTPALETMKTIFDGILHYRDNSALRLALTSRLINYSHEELLALDQDSVLFSKCVSTCSKLNQILHHQGVGKFFEHLLQSSWHFDHRDILQTILESEDGYEFYCAWQDLSDVLIGAQASQFLSPEGLLNFLNEFDTFSRNDDERTKAYIDQDEDGVTLLTTHVSKGLEFDIVFTLGLINQPKQTTDKLILIQQGSQQFLGAVNDHQDPNYQDFCEEMDAEKMRQLYVAFTRAKHRLYIPVIIHGMPTNIQPGNASPIELFLARLNQHPTNYPEWYNRLNNQDGAALTQFINLNQETIAQTFLNKNSMNRHIVSNHHSYFLTPPPKVTIPTPSLSIHSFSSIASSKQTEQVKKELIMPHAFNNEIKTVHTLPAGADTGTLLHKILETIPFHLAKEINQAESLIPWIHPLVQETPFAPWESVLAQIVLQTLQAPLPAPAPFSLSDLNPKKIFRETEFLYSSQNGFLKGVIDIFFEHNGLYYLIDWKSNWLGPSSADYHQNALQEAMHSNQYLLQTQIYLEGLERYLKLFDSRPFNELFGGCFYLFLRGISPHTGIWSHTVCGTNFRGDL